MMSWEMWFLWAFLLLDLVRPGATLERACENSDIGVTLARLATTVFAAVCLYRIG